MLDANLGSSCIVIDIDVVSTGAFAAAVDWVDANVDVVDDDTTDGMPMETNVDTLDDTLDDVDGIVLEDCDDKDDALDDAAAVNGDDGADASFITLTGDKWTVDCDIGGKNMESNDGAIWECAAGAEYDVAYVSPTLNHLGWLYRNPPCVAVPSVASPNPLVLVPAPAIAAAGARTGNGGMDVRLCGIATGVISGDKYARG